MSEQATWWAGPDGDAYHARNVGRVDANVEFFKRSLPQHWRSGPFMIRSAIEFGCGIGENMIALSKIIGGVRLYGVEVNATAAKKVPVGSVILGTVQDFKMPNNPRTFDLAFSKGCLIHVPPEDIELAYQRLFDASHKGIIIAEYFSPRREMIEYRGQQNRLWKADFGGEFARQFKGKVKLMDYGFVGRCDPTAPQDDLNWWTFRRID